MARAELAVLQGVGYPEPNLSHFRSIEIWDTASKSAEYLQDGWLTRAFAARPAPRGFAADGVIIGSGDLGPLAGGGTRAIALANTEQFLRRAKLAQPTPIAATGARTHAQGGIATSCRPPRISTHDTNSGRSFHREISAARFIRRRQVLANPSGVAVVRVTLTGFDTHANQAGTQARLLKEVARRTGGAQGCAGRTRQVERCAGAHLRRVRTPAEGESSPAAPTTARPTSSSRLAVAWRAACTARRRILSRLSGDGNPAYALDFRGVYAAVLDRWWGVDSRDGARRSDSRRCRSSRPDGRVPKRARSALASRHADRCRPACSSPVDGAADCSRRTTARTATAATAARMRASGRARCSPRCRLPPATRCCGHSTTPTASTGTTRRAAATASR